MTRMCFVAFVAGFAAGYVARRNPAPGAAADPPHIPQHVRRVTPLFDQDEVANRLDAYLADLAP